MEFCGTTLMISQRCISHCHIKACCFYQQYGEFAHSESHFFNHSALTYLTRILWIMIFFPKYEPFAQISKIWKFTFIKLFFPSHLRILFWVVKDNRVLWLNKNWDVHITRERSPYPFFFFTFQPPQPSHPDGAESGVALTPLHRNEEF